MSRAQSRTSFEDELPGQYRQIIKPRLMDELLDPLPAEERATVKPYYEYFDLCNEQVFLRMQGRVTRRTWNEWQEGIKANLGRGEMRDGWDTIVKRRDDFADFQELRLLFESEFGRDPRTWNPLWRRILRREQGASRDAVKDRATFGSPPGS